MLYFTVISIASLAITLGNFLADGVYTAGAFFLLLACTLAGVAAVIAVDGLFAFIVRRLPESWFAPEARLFTVSDREKKFYRRTRINVWKQYVPEWGYFTGFHKDRVRDPSSSAYIGRFLLESNYGVMGHIVGIFMGFAIAALPFLRPLTMALPIATVNAILNLLPTLILRANTPGLRAMYRRNLKRETRAKELTTV